MRYFLIFLTAFSFSFSSIALGQYYNTGQDPASLRWMQIETSNFKVIYPGTYGQEGIRFARALDKACSDLSVLYPGIKFRLPVIIHNYTTRSNGYVAWAPSRMEIYPTPEQNSIPLDPDRQLALHELTHVMQMESLNRGFTRAMSWLAGQQVPGIVSSLLPLWFLEGDAVFSESILSGSGRGRTPAFQKELKAITLEKGGMYKYDKAINGSFRDFVPDYYQTGYQTMAWSYYKYGPDIWKKALRTTADVPFSVNPVNISLRKNESVTKRILYEQAFDTLAMVWKRDDAASGFRITGSTNPSKKGRYADYNSPVFTGRDSIIAVKSTLTDPPSFVFINTWRGTEKRILVPGYGYPWYLSYAKGRLVWTETRTDPRWQNREFSVIKIMDLNNGSVRKLSSGSRYLSAAISGNGNFIAAAENTVENKNNLVLINALNGDVVEKIPSPGNAYLERPKWDESGRKIVFISLTDAGEGIIVYDRSDKKWATLMEVGSNDIQSVSLRNDSLFFVSSVSGTDNAYLMGPDGSVSLLTRSRFGVSDLDILNDKLLFSDYSASGNNIGITSIPDKKKVSEPYNYAASYLINRFNPSKYKSEAEPSPVLNPKPYRKWLHLFRFHSWMPFYADIEKIQTDPALVTPGLTLLTQNDLSTLISTFGYEYSGHLHKFHYGIKWYGWYLAFESRLDYGNIPEIDKFSQSVGDPTSIERGYELTNTISLPLSFRGGRFSQYLNLSVSSALQNNYIYLADKGVYDNLQNQVTGRIYFSNYQLTAVRDIYPRWAQVLDFSYSSYPADKEIYGNIATAKSSFFFPGPLKNHGFKIRLEAEKQNPVAGDGIIYGSRTSFPRGYTDVLTKEVQFASVDYFLPLFYPDLNISSLIYITRFRADLFYDYARIPGRYVFREVNGKPGLTYEEVPETYKSYGAELMSDFYVFRLPFQLSAGIQAAWLKPGNAPQMAFLFNINVFGMSIGSGPHSLSRPRLRP